MSLDTHSIALGDTLVAHVSNVTDEPQETGVKKKYDIQYQAESGWHSIFGTETEPLYHDLAYRHGPGEGFTWRLPVTEEGLTGAVEEKGATTYHVCDTLEPGTYRFVYWGITSEKLENRGYAIGMPFAVSRE